MLTPERAREVVDEVRATGAELGTFPLSDRPTRDGLRPMRDGRLLVATFASSSALRIAGLLVFDPSAFMMKI